MNRIRLNPIPTYSKMNLPPTYLLTVSNRSKTNNPLTVQKINIPLISTGLGE